MKVTFVALNYAPSIGGAQAHVQAVAEGLAGRGHVVEVLTTDSLGTPGSADPGQIPVKAESIAGVSVRRFGTRGPLGRTQTAARRVHRRVVVRRGGEALERPIPPVLCGPMSWGLARAVRRAHRQADVVVGCSAPFLTMVATPFLRGRGRAASMAMPLLHLEARSPHPWVVRALRRADGTTASTTHEQARQVGLGVAPDVIAVLPPGVDPDQFPETSPSEARAALGLPERLTVGYVGRLARYKGIDTMLAAAPAWWKERPELTVLVAGSLAGWEKLDETVGAAAAVGGDRLAVRHGFDDHEKALLLAACDVVVFPSREESFGMVTLEAWAARRPVVAADIAAGRCVIRDGVDGELVPVGDPDALVVAVGHLLDSPDRRAAYGAAGRAHVEAELSWSRIVDGWELALTDAMARARRRTVSPTGRA